MRWTTDTIRCVRRFAFFPTSMYDSDINKITTIWLEPYYIIQTRDIYEAKKCDTCKVTKVIRESKEPSCCAWYMDNVICGDKTINDCEEYINAEN